MQHATANDSTAMEIIARAIHAKQMITARYNGARIELCPHELFVRRQAVYLRALNPNKSRRHDEVATLGDFNITGMSDVTPSSRPFNPLPSFSKVASGVNEQSIISVLDG